MSPTAAPPQHQRQAGASRWTGGDDRRPPSRRITAIAFALVAAVVVVLLVVALLTKVLGGSGDTSRPTPTGPAPVPAAATLAWAPPQLVAPTTVQVTDAAHDLKLDKTKDYVLQLPAGGLHTKGTSIWGGHNVVLIGGQIDVPASDPGRGIALKSQTGTLHVEGLWITGAGLTEGIDLEQPAGAVVQLEDLRVDAPHGSRTTNHADVIQSWAGPRVLRIDRLSAWTTYQGFFLLPNQHFKGARPEGFDLRHIDLHGLARSGYMIWRDGADWPLAVQDVYVHRPDTRNRDALLWPKGSQKGTEVWPQVHIGTPPGGSFVPAGVAGTGYQSPGYAS